MSDATPERQDNPPRNSPEAPGTDPLPSNPLLNGLPMLEPLPPAAEEPTQPIPVSPQAPALDAEALAILEGPDATLRLSAGEPPTPDPHATLALLVGPHDAAPQAPLSSPSTPVLAHPQSRREGAQTMEIPSDQLPAPARKGMPPWGWGALGALVLLLSLGGVYLLRPGFLGLDAAETEALEASEAAPVPAPAPLAAEEPSAEIPPALRSYFEKARKGDAAAMRMLGVMYYNGLNVPRNETEGLKWYRKAAEAGSVAAQKELKALEGKASAK